MTAKRNPGRCVRSIAERGLARLGAVRARFAKGSLGEVVDLTMRAAIGLTVAWAACMFACSVAAGQQGIAGGGVGSLKGRIKSPAKITSLKAVDRLLRLEYEAELEPDGSFEIPNLLTDRRYDLIAQTPAGKYEGVDLAWYQEALGLAAAEALDPPRGQFTDGDRKLITDHIEKVRRFYDVTRPMYWHGQGDRCTVVVEQRRTTAFHGSKPGEVVWRVEIWYFRKHYGGWEHVSNQDRVLVRQRTKASDLERLNWMFLPALGGVYLPDAGQEQPLTLDLPPKFDPAHGLAASK